MRHPGQLCLLLVLGATTVASAFAPRGISAARAGAGVSSRVPAHTACNVGCGHLYFAGYSDIFAVVPLARAQAAGTPLQVSKASGYIVGATDPSVSPDGNSIVYAFNSSIAINAVTGGAQRLLIPAAAGIAIKEPAFAPNGQDVAYAREDISADPVHAVYGIAINHLAGGLVHTFVNAGHDRHFPAWTPDGRVIIASERESDAGARPYDALVAIDASTGQSTLLTHDPTNDYAYPAVSPDGRQIAAIQVPGSNSTSASLWVMNRDGSGGHVVQAPVNKARPSWSPDGTYLAYSVSLSVAIVPAGGGSAIAVSNLGYGGTAWSDAGASRGTAQAVSFGVAPHPLAHCGPGCGQLFFERGGAIYASTRLGVRRISAGGGPDRHPAVSPDGRWLAYQAGASAIAVRPSSGGPARTLGSLPFADNPSWAPNARALALGYNNAAAGYHGIGILSVPAGRELFAYAPRAGEPLYPAWSPDGRAFAASVVGDTGFAIREVSIASGADRTLTHDPHHQYFHPAYAPDGRLIACIRTTSITAHSGEIWVMNRDGTGGHVLARGVSDGQLAWSPDGQFIAYTVGQAIEAIPVQGGRARHLLVNAQNPAWSR